MLGQHCTNIDFIHDFWYNKIHQLRYSVNKSQQFSKAIHHSGFML